MKQAMTTTTVALALLLASCTQQGNTEAAQTAASAGGAPAAADQTKDTGMTELKPPSPDAVLYVIYQRDGDGAISYEIDGGAMVTYWYGYPFTLKGKQYFTGFATSTEGEEGQDAETGMMEPGHVAIAQATFVKGEDAGQAKWTQLDTDGYVGEFGSNDQADAVDDSRKPQSHEIADGRLLLAVPTRSFNDGIANASYAMFLFDPDNVDDLPFRKWGYLGSIAAGNDNAAGCEDGKVTPCAASTGTLSFEAAGQAVLPNVKVAFTGKEISGPGKVRDLGAEDALTYVFDTKEGRYQP